eukprot:CAMPEP_0198215020 /NCGR_PEP_ID=MMETSP1445-20131203/46343_1 /TAXON_ID=36898 /ORGANISM="Pyramimonas sp., Strain CCMP2087" /LENGTH=72 /DNA_ID=CAMNT_0043890517 /DNA_START=1 /DNA_END=216 /DNA_ORIENTATION=+
MLGPAVMLPLFGYTTSSLLAAMFVLSVLMGLATINLSGVLANHLDIAPLNVGEMQGITNTVATLPGMASVTI